MRANEFINEGWYDDAKAKVKTATDAVKSSKVGQAVGGAVQGVQQANQAVQQAVAPVLSGASRVASAVRQGSLGYKQSQINRTATKSFIKKFNQQIDYNMANARRQGMQFSMSGFINGYLTKYHWKSGAYQQQLVAAIQANDRRKIPQIMAQIGLANTDMSGGKAIQGAAVDPNAPVPAPAAAPAAAASMGGAPLDPNDPASAQILAAMKKQGKI